MFTLLRRPKAVLLLFVAGLIFVTSLAGGALGHAFGMGFLGSPLPAIQLPAEAITSGPTLAGFTVTNTMARVREEIQRPSKSLILSIRVATFNNIFIHVFLRTMFTTYLA